MVGEKNMSNEGSGGHTITYTVDGDMQTTTEHKLTPRQILVNAHLDPSERYLLEIKGKHKESFQDRMDELIPIHEHQKFITAFVGAVPVS